METSDLLNDYKEVKECDFKGEHYSVRDNGAVLRHARPGKRVRKDDERWTFGVPNDTNGYMFIGGIVRVHQIVATAYFGERDTKVYVVDHKDSNRRNNRVENLHWLTRLQNALNNPATRKKIIMCCGSLEAFLNNPAMLRRFADQNPNFSWMRSVSKEEGRHALKNMNEWAHRPIEEPKGGSMGEWIYKPRGYNPQMEIIKKQMSLRRPQPSRLSESKVDNPSIEKNEFVAAKSPSIAVQKKWITPTDFPLCPSKITETPLLDYYAQLSSGKLITMNVYGGTTILEYAMNKDNNYFWVLSKRTEQHPIKAWVLMGVYVKNGRFVHENLGSFFEEIGGYKYFTLAQGKEWTGGDCSDDYVS